MYHDCDLCVVFVLYVLNNENQCLMHPGYYLLCGTRDCCVKFGNLGHLLCIACI
jgi:hypothetical protein